LSTRVAVLSECALVCNITAAATAKITALIASDYNLSQRGGNFHHRVKPKDPSDQGHCPKAID